MAHHGMTQDRANLTGLVESPVPGNRPAGFGGRAEETGRSKDRYRVSVRPYNYVIHPGPIPESVQSQTISL
jgi:hypothetical protein